MNIDQYPINFGYGETTTLNGAPYTHRGNDYPLINQPVLINGTQIGISGATGLVSGPHVHAQAGRDEWAQQTINPTPYVGEPGTIVKTGSASQWGNYVCVRVGDVNVFYCHLSRIDVQVGKIIGGEEDMPNSGDVKNVYKLINNKDAAQSEVDYYTSKPWNAPDGLYYGKIMVDYKNLQKFLQDAVNSPGKDSEKIKKIKEIVNG